MIFSLFVQFLKGLLAKFLLGALPIAFPVMLLSEAAGAVFRRSGKNPALTFSRNFIRFMPPLFLAHLLFFTLKAWGNARGVSYMLAFEAPLWKHLLPIFEKLPPSLAGLLDFLYTSFWKTAVGLSWCFFLLLDDPSGCFAAVCMLYVFSGLVHLLLPVNPPIYAFEGCFPHISNAPISLVFHHMSDLCRRYLSHHLIPPQGIIFYPVASFPSLHIALLYLSVRAASCRMPGSWRFARLVLWTFFLGISAGSVVLGYHYLSDCLAGILLVEASNKVKSFEPGERGIEPVGRTCSALLFSSAGRFRGQKEGGGEASRAENRLPEGGGRGGDC